MANRLSHCFYERDVVAVARSLLGQVLVRVDQGRRLAGRIVETEAYLGIPDKAAHTFNGRRTARNESMWTRGGHAYVYFVYGMHYCLNVVAGRDGDPVAVLLRALEPLEGLVTMHANRGPIRGHLDLCRGPARLTQALNIDRTMDGVDLTASKTLFVERRRRRATDVASIRAGPRVGVAYAEDWKDKPLRFFFEDNPHVSTPRGPSSSHTCKLS